MFSIVGEFMLPSSNILPRTYRDLHAIMIILYIMDNMRRKQNSQYVVSLDIEPIK